MSAPTLDERIAECLRIRQGARAMAVERAGDGAVTAAQDQFETALREILGRLGLDLSDERIVKATIAGAMAVADLALAYPDRVALAARIAERSGRMHLLAVGMVDPIVGYLAGQLPEARS